MTEANTTPTAQPSRRSRARFRIGIIAVVVVVGGIGMVFAAVLGAARENAMRIRCTNNLKQIGLNCRMYALDNDGHYPSRWVELNWVGEKENNAKLLLCPFTRRDVGAWSQVDLWSDYRLVPGRSESDPPDTVLAIEPLANHDSGDVNVLFVNGSVEAWPAARVLSLPAAPKDTTAGSLSGTNPPVRP